MKMIKSHGLMPDKRFGQNFLLNSDITDRIARLVPRIAESTVVEVGPGPAGLTRSLLEAGAKRVIAIELDARAIGILEEVRASYPALEVLNADAMEIDVADFGVITICANLPYNISVPLLAGWCMRAASVPNMVLMFQKEVARRIASKPGSKEYGRISVLAQLCYDVKCEFDLSPKCFTPAPKVVSTVVSFKRRPDFARPELLDRVDEILRAAFGGRRKMLRQSLKGLFTSEKLEAMGIAPTARAEELSPGDFLRLSASVHTRARR